MVPSAPTVQRWLSPPLHAHVPTTVPFVVPLLYASRHFSPPSAVICPPAVKAHCCPAELAQVATWTWRFAAVPPGMSRQRPVPTLRSKLVGAGASPSRPQPYRRRSRPLALGVLSVRSVPVPCSFCMAYQSSLWPARILPPSPGQ